MNEVVYITRTGAVLRREGAKLQVWAARTREAEFAVEGVEQVVLIGGVTVTPAAMDLLLERGIDTVLLTQHGRFRGRITAAGTGNVRLRLAQYAMACDPAKTLDAARRFVAAKVHNQRVMLLRHLRRHGDDEVVEASVRAMRAALERLALCDDLDTLRGCEGSAAAAYFRAFGRLLRAEGLRFDGRNRRPPVDPVNALLSFGYTLLANVVEAAVARVGLDPYLGALHAPEAGRPSLVCDLMEEFRAAIVDPLVVSGVNQRAFKPEDFEDAGPGEPVVMKHETVRWLLTLFERRMARTTPYGRDEAQRAWRDVIEQQARAFARHVAGREAYEGYRMR
ncbi:MAG: CRISPR-associated endonuclease Cas1 [Polyangiales bacterium]